MGSIVFTRIVFICYFNFIFLFLSLIVATTFIYLLYDVFFVEPYADVNYAFPLQL